MSDTITHIEEIRAQNNKLWMKLLRLALDWAPTEARAVLKEINANDRLISDALGRLADE